MKQCTRCSAILNPGLLPAPNGCGHASHKEQGYASQGTQPRGGLTAGNT